MKWDHERVPHASGFGQARSCGTRRTELRDIMSRKSCAKRAGDRRAASWPRRLPPPLPPVLVFQVRGHRRFLQGYSLLAFFPPVFPLRLGRPGPACFVRGLRRSQDGATMVPMRTRLWIVASCLPVGCLIGCSAGAQAPGEPIVFSPTDSMNVARDGHTATLLQNGTVLIAGGEGTTVHSLASAEIYDPSTGRFRITGSMTVSRTGHAATLLANGKVLVIGGYNFTDSYSPNVGVAIGSAELYDPSTGTFVATGSGWCTGKDTATLLPSGTGLITDGEDGGAELYDPAGGTFTATGGMPERRFEHTATLLGDGTVLVAGGVDPTYWEPRANAELYIPAAGTFATTGSMSQPRAGHAATLLQNGMVLFTGGEEYDVNGTPSTIASAELYDPSTAAFSAIGSMTVARISHMATLLPSGNVLITGGSDQSEFMHPLASAELCDPGTGTFIVIGNTAKARWSHTATLLDSGMVLIAGGRDNSSILASAELYE